MGKFPYLDSPMYQYTNLGKQHIVAALEKVGHGRKDKNGYPIEIDFNELPMLVHMRSAVPGPRTPFFVCELEDGTRLDSIFFELTVFLGKKTSFRPRIQTC